MTVWLHPDAEAELGDAAVYYAAHASTAIATAFLAEFERMRDLIAENPHLGAEAAHGFRIFHFDRFPYTAIYAVEDRLGIVIYAVAHQHREPGYWLERT